MSNDYRIELIIESSQIAYLHKIFEGYDGLGLVTTQNPREGRVIIHVTPTTRDDVLEILNNFPRPINVLTKN